MVLKLDVPFLYFKINRTTYDLIVFELWFLMCGHQKFFFKLEADC
jgi:hypothetical protein